MLSLIMGASEHTLGRACDGAECNAVKPIMSHMEWEKEAKVAMGEMVGPGKWNFGLLD